MNIKDIAREANVSISTVSRVLNHATNVSKSTEQRVKAVIEKYNFTQNQGKTAQEVRHRQILIIIPTLSNAFFSIVTKGILNTCMNEGFSVFMGVTEYSYATERHYLNMLSNGQFDGIISFYSDQPVDELEKLAAEHPYMQVSNYVESPHLSHVSIDDAKAAYEATEYFIKKGHSRIGFIGGFHNCCERRELGFRKALEDYGLECDPACIVRPEYKYDSGFEYDSGVTAGEQLLSLDNPPTAILSIFDTFAVGVSRYALSKGLMPGKDVAIIGFDNSAESKVFFPPISSVSHPKYEIGCLAASILLEQIQKKDLQPRQITVPHELILRDSS